MLSADGTEWMSSNQYQWPSIKDTMDAMLWHWFLTSKNSSPSTNPFD